MSSEQSVDVFTEVIERDRKRILAIDLEIKKLEHERAPFLTRRAEEERKIENIKREITELRNQDGRISEHEEAIRERISELYAQMPDLRGPDAVHSPYYSLVFEKEKKIHELEENGIEGCDQQLHELYKRIKEKEKEIREIEINITKIDVKAGSENLRSGIREEIEKFDEERKKLEAEIEQMLVGVKQFLLKMGKG